MAPITIQHSRGKQRIACDVFKTTALDIQTSMNEHHGYRVAQYQLIHADRVMCDYDVLHDHGVTKGSIIHLVLVPAPAPLPADLDMTASNRDMNDIFNPDEECGICTNRYASDRPEIRLSCCTYSLCASCIPQLLDCPSCREPIDVKTVVICLLIST